MGGIFDEGKKRERLAELDYLSAQNEFWENQEQAQTLLKERTQIKNHLDRLDELQSQLDDIDVLLEIVADKNVNGLTRIEAIDVAERLGGRGHRFSALMTLYSDAQGMDLQVKKKLLVALKNNGERPPLPNSTGP